MFIFSSQMVAVIHCDTTIQRFFSFQITPLMKFLNIFINKNKSMMLFPTNSQKWWIRVFEYIRYRISMEWPILLDVTTIPWVVFSKKKFLTRYGGNEQVIE